MAPPPSHSGEEDSRAPVRIAKPKRVFGLLPLLGAAAVAASLAVAPGGTPRPLLMASASTPAPTCTQYPGGVQICQTPSVPSPSVAPPTICPGQLTGGSSCAVPPPSPPPTLPVPLPSPLPCPAPLAGTVCIPPSASHASNKPPPALPPTSNPAAECAGPEPAASAPNTWTSYGEPVTVDFPPTPNPIYGDSVYPLWFVPVVDRFQACRAYRISVDHLRIERSLDYGQSWHTVLDGGQVPSSTTPPSFRSIVVAAPDHVFVTETGNGDALVASADGGTHWSLADGQLDDSANLVGEFTHLVVAGPQRADGGVGVLYAATLVCSSHTRPVPSDTCNGNTSPTGHIATGEHAGGLADDMGPVRLYSSHDGGVHWQLFGDDSVNGLPSNCAVQRIFIMPDPFSSPDADHLWISFLPGGLVNTGCPPAGTLAELKGDGAGGYQAMTMAGHNYSGTSPFVVTHGGPGGIRLLSGDISVGYSDDGGLTWNQVGGLPQVYPRVTSVATDGRDNVFGVAFRAYPGNDSGDALDFRAIVHRAGDPHGVADVELGAALPPPPGAPDRSNFNYPHYDPLIPNMPHYGEALGATTGPYATDIEYGGKGTFYVPIGNACYTAHCTWDGKTPDSRTGQQPNPGNLRAAQWRLMRYTMPPAGTLPILTGLPSLSDQKSGAAPHTTVGCKNTGRCNLVPLHSCAIQAPAYTGAPDLNGTLAFDGYELLYTRSFERSTDADPYSAVVRRLNPRTCTDTGAVTVHFPSDQYDRARAETWTAFGWYGPYMTQPQVPANRPLVDSITYDALHDRVYFTLRSENLPVAQRKEDDGEAGGTNQLALWSADLNSVDGIPASSLTASLVSVTTGHCTSSTDNEPGAGSRTLAFDRMGDNLPSEGHPEGVIWACLPARPAALDTSGRQVDQSCYGSFEMNGSAGAGLDVASWTMEDQSPAAGHHRAFLFLDEARQTSNGVGRVAVFDLARCQEDRMYDFTTNLHAATMGSTSLACDPVTYGTTAGAQPVDTNEVTRLSAQQQVPPFTGVTRGAVLWSRVGTTLQANLVPDNGDGQVSDPAGAQTCRLPTQLTYTGPVFAPPGSVVPVSARLSVIGPDAPVAGQTVRIDVNGQLLGSAATQRDGTVSFNYTVPAGGQVSVQLYFDPPASDVAYLQSDGSGRVEIGFPPPLPPLPPQPNTSVLPALPPGAPQFITVPALQVVHQPAAPAIAPAQVSQGNTVSSQGPGQPAAAKEEEEQKQLALAVADDTEPEEAAAQTGLPPGDDTTVAPDSGSYAITAVQHTDQADPAFALGAGLVASSFGFLAALRLRRRHEMARTARGAGRVHRRRR
jgi:hypothetical protein